MPLAKGDDFVTPPEGQGNPNAPMTAEEMQNYLAAKFRSSYTKKFKITPTRMKNNFSVSTLVGGPGTCMGYRKRNKVDANMAEEPGMFNPAIFRGSAIHKYAEQFLPDWYAYETKHVREVFPYDWKDGTKDLIVYGHPDFCKDNMVLELKTIESQMETEKFLKYRASTLWKAKKQVGCYARMLSREIGRKYYAYVVIIDKKLSVEVLSDDEMVHGYNYVRWCVYEVARRIEEEEIRIEGEIKKDVQEAEKQS